MGDRKDRRCYLTVASFAVVFQSIMSWVLSTIRRSGGIFANLSTKLDLSLNFGCCDFLAGPAVECAPEPVGRAELFVSSTKRSS
jgi:hypothetical protein